MILFPDDPEMQDFYERTKRDFESQERAYGDQLPIIAALMRGGRESIKKALHNFLELKQEGGRQCSRH